MEHGDKGVTIEPQENKNITFDFGQLNITDFQNCGSFGFHTQNSSFLSNGNLNSQSERHESGELDIIKESRQISPFQLNSQNLEVGNNILSTLHDNQTQNLRSNAFGDFFHQDTLSKDLKESLNDSTLIHHPSRKIGFKSPKNSIRCNQGHLCTDLLLGSCQYRHSIEEVEFSPYAGRENEALKSFICPITREIMKKPVVAADGHSYEHSAITKWMSAHSVSPLTRKPMARTTVLPNLTLQKAIEEYFDRQAHRQKLEVGSGGMSLVHRSSGSAGLQSVPTSSPAPPQAGPCTRGAPHTQIPGQNPQKEVVLNDQKTRCFVYQAIFEEGISVRRRPSFSERTGDYVGFGEIVCGNLRQTCKNNEVWVRLENDNGWVPESRNNTTYLERYKVEEGLWAFEVSKSFVEKFGSLALIQTAPSGGAGGDGRTQDEGTKRIFRALFSARTLTATARFADHSGNSYVKAEGTSCWVCEKHQGDPDMKALHQLPLDRTPMTCVITSPNTQCGASLYFWPEVSPDAFYPAVVVPKGEKVFSPHSVWSGLGVRFLHVCWKGQWGWLPWESIHPLQHLSPLLATVAVPQQPPPPPPGAPPPKPPQHQPGTAASLRSGSQHHLVPPPPPPGPPSHQGHARSLSGGSHSGSLSTALLVDPPSASASTALIPYPGNTGTPHLKGVSMGPSNAQDLDMGEGGLQREGEAGSSPIGARVQVVLGSEPDSWLVVLDEGSPTSNPLTPSSSCSSGNNSDTGGAAAPSSSSGAGGSSGGFQTRRWNNLPSGMASQLGQCGAQGRRVTRAALGQDGSWFLQHVSPVSGGAGVGCDPQSHWYTENPALMVELQQRDDLLNVAFGGVKHHASSSSPGSTGGTQGQPALDQGESQSPYVLIFDGYFRTSRVDSRLYRLLKSLRGVDHTIERLSVFSEGWFMRYSVHFKNGQSKTFSRWNVPKNKALEAWISKKSAQIQAVASSSEDCWIVVNDYGFDSSAEAPTAVKVELANFFKRQRAQMKR